MFTSIHSTDKAPKQQGLYLVSTPIGNLRDITLRALDVLSDADAVLCEDTRVTGKLMQVYNFKKKLIVYNDHSDDVTREYIIARLQKGEALALVTDAGTPCLSDPGFKLVQAALAAGVKVIPVPGASALLPALQLGALPSDRFLFAGFLPHKTSARRAVFEELKNVPATLVFYESPNRIVDCIADAFAVLGDRPVATARELTKMFEEARHGTLAAWAADETLLGVLKGEIVLMIGAPLATAALSDDDIKAMLKSALQTMSVKDAAAFVSAATGTPKKIAYDLALSCRHENG
jgi:16S rRNA (cytidine1402-2'-O)-methyltransferase